MAHGAVSAASGQVKTSAKRPNAKRKSVADEEPSVGAPPVKSEVDIEDLVAEATPARKNNHGAAYHEYSTAEVEGVRKELLAWYDRNQRLLPWRKPTEPFSKATADKVQLIEESAMAFAHVDRGYAVWVSEIMLQQTQVATVKDYYKRWMKKWPTVEALAAATIEEVNSVWQGLGYYQRARRLHEAAVKVTNEFKGKLPHTAEELEKHIPGVGKYTAGAISSIAYGQRAAIVDGNVVRVLARMRAIGCDPKSSAAVDHFWKLALEVVDEQRPGDFNEAMMELGATVCTPKAPACGDCPVAGFCRAYAETVACQRSAKERLTKQRKTRADADADCSGNANAAPACQLCAANEGGRVEVADTAMAYPGKSAKKAPRTESVAVCIVHRKADGEEHFLMVRRPAKGLLAGLWEFPNVSVEAETDAPAARRKAMDGYVSKNFGIKLPSEGKSRRELGQVVHMFSHVHHTYIIESAAAPDGGKSAVEDPDGLTWKWVPLSEMKELPISTAMRKVYATFNTTSSAAKGSGKASAKKSAAVSGKQPGIAAFFAPKK